MKRWILCAAIPLALVSLAFVPTIQGQGGGGGGGTPSKLGGIMHDMDETVKSLTKAIDTKGAVMEPLLGDVAKLQRLVLDAKGELPDTVTSLTDAKAKKKATLGYKTDMLDLERACLDLELAMLNEDAKKADKALREIDKVKGAGHSEFRKEK